MTQLQDWLTDWLAGCLMQQGQYENELIWFVIEDGSVEYSKPVSLTTIMIQQINFVP